MYPPEQDVPRSGYPPQRGGEPQHVMKLMFLNFRQSEGTPEEVYTDILPNAGRFYDHRASAWVPRTARP